MKFIDGIKFGASFYLGWTIMKTLDRVLGNPKRYMDEVKIRLKMMEEEPKEKKIIGFHL